MFSSVTSKRSSDTAPHHLCTLRSLFESIPLSYHVNNTIVLYEAAALALLPSNDSCVDCSWICAELYLPRYKYCLGSSSGSRFLAWHLTAVPDDAGGWMRKSWLSGLRSSASASATTPPFLPLAYSDIGSELELFMQLFNSCTATLGFAFALWMEWKQSVGANLIEAR